MCVWCVTAARFVHQRVQRNNDNIARGRPADTAPTALFLKRNMPHTVMGSAAMRLEHLKGFYVRNGLESKLKQDDILMPVRRPGLAAPCHAGVSSSCRAAPRA
jgi:hypothetical protein